jgi:hypothetical protein
MGAVGLMILNFGTYLAQRPAFRARRRRNSAKVSTSPATLQMYRRILGRPIGPDLPCRGLHLGYGRGVPRVCAFYGVVIYMYWNERDHPVAHFHAYHAGRRASVSADGVLLAGSLESRALGFVQEWASLRHDEIMANWERARKNEPLLAIPPLP